MRKEFALRLFNSGLRALAMGSRFVLVIALARLLAPADVGLFGLLVATVSFSVLVIGGDYYTYSQRELLTEPRERWSFVLQHHALATGVLYLVLLPLQAVIFWLGLLPVGLMAWFFVLLVVEHVGQEINRTLVAMQRPLVASMVLFVRLGAWVWVVVPLMWIRGDKATLDMVFAAWLAAGIVAIAAGLAIIHREAAPFRWWRIDWSWLRRGFRVGFLFLFATMCFKALFTADRYLVAHLMGADWLGVYVLYVSLALAAVTFLDPAVFSFLYPKMVASYRRGDWESYRKYMREMAISASALSLFMAGCIVIAAPFALEWAGRSIYLQDLAVLWLLLGVSVVYAIGMVPHYGLYAKGADRSIVVAHISSVAVFVVSAYFASRVSPLYAVPAALFVTFTFIAVFKAIAYAKIGRDPQVTSDNAAEKIGFA